MPDTSGTFPTCAFNSAGPLNILLLSPACLAYLGNIDPKDVSVEVYYGKISPEGTLQDSASCPMKLVQKNGEMYEYKAEIPMKNGGNYGFTYRIIPNNPMLVNKQDLGLIKWVL